MDYVRKNNGDDSNICGTEKGDESISDKVSDHQMIVSDKLQNKSDNNVCGDVIKHGDTKEESNQNIDFSVVLINNDDGNKVCDHNMDGHNKQSHNICESNEGNDNSNHRSAAYDIKKEVSDDCGENHGDIQN